MTAAPSIQSVVLVPGYDPVPHVRIEVDAPGARYLTIYRQTAYARDAVREAEMLPIAEGAFVRDFECPKGMDFYYVAQAFDANRKASPVSAATRVLVLEGEDCIIQDPRDPTTFVVAELTAEALTAMQYVQEQAISAAVGQPLPSGPIGARQGASDVPLDVITKSAFETAKLERLFRRAGAVMFRLPASAPDELKGYWAVQVQRQAIDPVKRGGWSRWNLKGTMVARPGFSAIVHHGTYADLEKWPSYAHISSGRRTYAELEANPFYEGGVSLRWFVPDPENPGLWLLTDTSGAVRESAVEGLYDFDQPSTVMEREERSGTWVQREGI